MKFITSSFGECKEIYEYFLEEILNIPSYEGILVLDIPYTKQIKAINKFSNPTLFLFLSKLPRLKNITVFNISQKNKLKDLIKDKSVLLPSCTSIGFIKSLKIKDYKILNTSFLFFKSEKEKKKIHEAYRETEKLILNIYEKLKSYQEPLSETELSIYIKNYLINKNLFWSFEPRVAFNKNTSNIHHKPTETKQKPELIMLDIGVIKNKYCSDITVMFVNKNKKQLIRQIQTIDQIKQNIHTFISKNLEKITYKDIDEFARKEFIKNNLEKYMYSNFHALSHSIGRKVHEYIPENLIFPKKTKYSYFTIEPAIYTKDYGIRLEDTIEINHNTGEAKRLNSISSFFLF